MKTLTVRHEDLPLVLVVVGKNGQRKPYQIKPAGKDKFGACLAGLESKLVEKMLESQMK